MNKSNLNLNIKYALANVGYMLLVSGSLGFAYNYLSQSGFDDGTIGTVMSLVSLIGVFLGPAAADVVDRSPKLTQKMFITASMVVCGVFATILAFIPAGSFLIIPVIILSFMCSTVGMPLLNGMAFIYEKTGGVINYGLCRGIGSAAYAVGSFVVGRLWAVVGRNTLPWWVLAMAIFTIVVMQFMPDPPKLEREDKGSDEQSISMLQFFGKYRKVAIVVGGLTLMFFCHSLIQNFMAKIIGQFDAQNIEAVQGTALLIQAMVELPTMFGFSLLMKRFGIPRILVVASILYSVKHLVILFCGSVPMFYGAMVLQMLSFAAITPAAVYLANDMVNEADRNKGQAVFSAAQTIGGLLASFVGGWMFQFLPVKFVVGFGVAASIAGTVIMVLSMRGASRPARAKVRM